MSVFCLQNLLTQLVNKLGDPERKVASRAAFFLLKLRTLLCQPQSLLSCAVFVVGHHPNMQLVVLKEIERLLYRPNIQSKAQ